LRILAGTKRSVKTNEQAGPYKHKIFVRRHFGQAQNAMEIISKSIA